MKAARLVVLGVAVAAGGVAAFLASSSNEPAPPPPAPVVAPLETVEVLVAKTDLDRGQLIGKPDIGWQAWPKAAANASFIKKIRRPNAIKISSAPSCACRSLPGEPIHEPMVVIRQRLRLHGRDPAQGMRAVAMDISADTSAGGFILPDDHVDVVLTRRDKAAEKTTGIEKFASDTILRNVRVLAVDQTIEEKSGQKVVVGKTATLELTQAQAETLELSRQLGTLSLTLRSLRNSSRRRPRAAEKPSEHERSINTVRFGVSTTVNRPLMRTEETAHAQPGHRSARRPLAGAPASCASSCRGAAPADDASARRQRRRSTSPRATSDRSP